MDEDIHKFYLEKLTELQNRLKNEVGNAPFSANEEFIECTVSIEVDKSEKVCFFFIIF